VIDMEKELRAEFKRVTGQVQPGQLRPLRSPERGRAGRRRAGVIVVGAAIVSAAAVVAALLVSTVASPRPATVAAAAPAGLPPYYVVATQSASAGPVQVVVRSSVTGRETGALTVPNAVGHWAALAGAGDGRQFALETGTSSSVRFYSLSVSRNGRPALRLAATYPYSEMVLNRSIALSPNGNEVALSQTGAAPCLGNARRDCEDFQIEVINLATRATRTWNEDLPTAFPLYTPGVPTWAGNTLLTFTLSRINSATAPGPASVAIRTLNTASPGSDMVTSAPLPLPAAVRHSAHMTVTDGGSEVIGTSCVDSRSSASLHGTGVARVVELSAADGWAVRQFRTQTTYFRWPAREQVAFETSCTVLSTDPTGQYALVLAFGLGRFHDGVYTPLPGFHLYLTTGDPVAQAAW
jgi:hypothetical protein